MKIKKSLSVRISIYFLLVGLLPFLVLSVFSYARLKESFSQIILESRMELINQIGTAIDRMVFSALNEIKSLSNNTVLCSKETSMDEKLHEIEKIQDFYKIFENITLLSPGGSSGSVDQRR